MPIKKGSISRRKKNLVRAVEKHPRSVFSGKLVVSAVVLLVLIMGFVTYEKRTAPIMLGLNLELSGDLAKVGISSQRGAELAVKQINDHGGVLIDGSMHHLQLVVGDNQSTVTGARAVTNEQSGRHVSAMIGPNASSYAIAAAEIAEGNSLLMVSPWSTSPQTTLASGGQFKQFVFRTAFIDPFQGKALAEFALKDLRAKNAVVLYDNSADVLKGQANYFSDAFSAHGGTVIEQTGLTSGAGDYSEVLRSVLRDQPDVIFLPAYFKDAAAVIKQAKQMGITASFLGTDAWDSSEMIRICSSDCDGDYLSAHYSADASPISQKYATLYNQTYGVAADDVSALTYDSVGLVVQAMQDCNCTTAEGIASGMHRIYGFGGVTGEITFLPNSSDPMKSVTILQIKNGSLVFKGVVNPQ